MLPAHKDARPDLAHVGNARMPVSPATPYLHEAAVRPAPAVPGSCRFGILAGTLSPARHVLPRTPGLAQPGAHQFTQSTSVDVHPLDYGFPSLPPQQLQRSGPAC